jgi:hypothetical protein
MDLLLDLNPISPSYGDLTFVNGPLPRYATTQELTEVVGQRLYIRLRTFREEWFINTEYGVPYWQRILGRKISKSAVDLIFQEQILAETGVQEITFFNSTFINRKYSLQFRVRVSNGQEIETINLNPIN